MIALLQRVNQAKLFVENELFSQINQGIVIFLSISRQDKQNQIIPLIKKIINLKMFLNNQKKLGKSVKEINGEILLVSQFTLYGEIKKGTKPSFSKSADKIKAKQLYDLFHKKLKENFDGKVSTGQFGYEMNIHLHLVGPVTFFLKTDN